MSERTHTEAFADCNGVSYLLMQVHELPAEVAVGIPQVWVRAGAGDHKVWPTPAPGVTVRFEDRRLPRYVTDPGKP